MFDMITLTIQENDIHLKIVFFNFKEICYDIERTCIKQGKVHFYCLLYSEQRTLLSKIAKKLGEVYRIDLRGSISELRQ